MINNISEKRLRDFNISTRAGDLPSLVEILVTNLLNLNILAQHFTFLRQSLLFMNTIINLFVFIFEF